MRKTIAMAACGLAAALLTMPGCGVRKDPSMVPPAPTTATLPPLPANVPPAAQEQARQQMMSSMQAGRVAAQHVNGQTQ